MYIQVDEDFQEHPKARRLCRLLMNPLGWGYCILLWRWCTKFRRDGDLTGIDPADLEYNLGWTLDPGKLYRGFVEAGFIDEVDGRVLVHAWMEYQGASIEKIFADRNRKRDSRRCQTVTAVMVDPAKPANETLQLAEIPQAPDVSTDSPRTVRGQSEFVHGPARLALRSVAKQSNTPEGEDAEDGEKQLELGTPLQSIRRGKPQVDDGTPVVRVVACDGPIATWNLTEGYIAAAQAYFPSFDVRGAFTEACFWLEANPERRKTASGMNRFLAGWLTRARNRGSGGGGGGGSAPPRQSSRGTSYPKL